MAYEAYWVFEGGFHKLKPKGAYEFILGYIQPSLRDKFDGFVNRYPKGFPSFHWLGNYDTMDSAKAEVECRAGEISGSGLLFISKGST